MDKKCNCSCKPSVLGLGLAIGLTSAVCMLVFTVCAWAFDLWPTWVSLVAECYPGYGTSLVGVILGTVYAFIDGFVIGLLVAWFYGLVGKCCNCSCGCKK